MSNKIYCPHKNLVVDQSGKSKEPDCGCRFVFGKTPEEIFPTPWAVRTLMIVDANERIIIHMGGQQSYIGNLHPEELVKLNERIVRAVNFYAQSDKKAET